MVSVINTDIDIATLPALLGDRANRLGNREVYTFLDGDNAPVTISCAHLSERAGIIAGGLRDNGMFLGDRVLLIYTSRPHFIEALFGCFLAGVIAVPVSPPKARRSLDILRSIAANCRPAALLTTNSFREALQSRLANAPELSTVSIFTTDGCSARAHEQLSVNPDTPAMLQYTSGSTGILQSS